MTASPVETDRAALERLNAEWGDAASRGEFETVVALYTTDATLLWPDLPAVQGTSGIRQAWNALHAEVPEMVISFTSKQIDLSGDGHLAVDYGVVTLRESPGGDPLLAKYLVTWKKVNGEWKVLYDAWNYNDKNHP